MPEAPDIDPGSSVPVTRLAAGGTIADGLSLSVFLFCFGAVFIGMGLWSLLPDLLHGHLLSPGLPGALVFIGFGLMVALGGLSRASMFVRFGKARAEVAPPEVRPGDRFLFHYHRPLRMHVKTDLAVALVLREVITSRSGGETETKCLDHVVRHHEQKGLCLDGGHVLKAEYEFQVPEAGTRAFTVGDWPLLWVIKVHVELRRGLDFWEEYELPVTEEPRPPAGPGESQEAADRYDVVLVRGSALNCVRTMGVMTELMPYLNASQVGDFYFSAPIVLLEQVARKEAEIARARLEAAGATVEVRRGGEAVAKHPAYDLPVPHEGPSVSADALPIPARPETTDREEEGTSGARSAASKTETE
jgi:hypothetical protein